MISNLFDALFGCWHRHYSFPITMRAGSLRTSAPAPTGTYVVCLDCGKEFQYDWHEMKVVWHPENRARTLVANEATWDDQSLLPPRSASGFLRSLA
jgi:hypothetical protein